MKIEGAYVQAWVWVELDQPAESATVSDAVFRAKANQQYQEAGQVEIDPHARVSREKQ